MRRAISSSVACLEEGRAVDIVAPIAHARTTKATRHAKTGLEAPNVAFRRTGCVVFTMAIVKIPRPTHMSIGEKKIRQRKKNLGLMPTRSDRKEYPLCS